MNSNAMPDNVRPIVFSSTPKADSANPGAAPQVDIATLDTLLNQIRQMAHGCDRDCIQLLIILRGLESVHREIREDLFQPALPDNRQALYALLRDIESDGGWPFINRMKLQEFLRRVEEAEDASETPNP